MLKHILFLLLLFINFFGFSQGSWQLKKDTNNIKIYTRPTTNSNFNEYKAVTSIATSLDVVLKELLSAPQYNNNHQSGISYYVKQLNENQHVFYAHKPLPWPIKDRDIVTLLTIERINDNKIKLILESLPEAVPEKSKTLRIKKLMGHWLLEETENNKVMITQQLLIDPEGSLPPFIVNKLLVKGPFKTFTELQDAVKTKK